MSHPDGLPDLFIDRSLGRLRVPAGLRGAGLRLRTLAEHYGIPEDENVEDITWLIFDEARLMEGEKPQNASDFATRLTRILIEAAARPAA